MRITLIRELDALEDHARPRIAMVVGAAAAQRLEERGGLMGAAIRCTSPDTDASTSPER